MMPWSVTAVHERRLRNFSPFNLDATAIIPLSLTPAQRDISSNCSLAHVGVLCPCPPVSQRKLSLLILGQFEMLKLVNVCRNVPGSRCNESPPSGHNNDTQHIAMLR